MNLNNPISTQVLFDALEIGEKFFCLTKARKEKVHSTAVRPASQEKVLVLFVPGFPQFVRILYFFKYNFISFNEFEIKKLWNNDYFIVGFFIPRKCPNVKQL